MKGIFEMNRVTVLAIGLIILAGCATMMRKEQGPLQCWAVDPLVKVFQDAMPGDGKAHIDVARGEHASFQIVVRTEDEVTALRAEASPLKRKGGGGTLTPKPVRFVGYVPVDRPTQTPSKDQLRKPPADYPDPLLEAASIDVAPGKAQPVWVTVPVPLDAKPGTYRGTVTLTAHVNHAAASAELPLTLRVYDVAVEKTRLWVTEWYSMQWQHMKIDPEHESDDYYALLRRYARNMAEHRHNVALISPIGLAEYSANDDGSLNIDFSKFDRWVTIFQEEGVIGRIEGGHIGGRKGGWESDFVVQTRRVEDGKVVSEAVSPDTSKADAFYKQFFPTLVAHLKEKEWLGIYMQHLADEPIESNVASYRAMAALARKYAPELPIIEACHTKELTGAMDVWVPQLNYLHRDYEHYLARQAAGDEVWFYTCVFPQGEYANRFLEQPLIKTRLLHWINFRYGATGYLHWGYNQWTKDSPFTHTTRPHGGPPYLPAGDPWIVYPGEKGPLDSIRFEAMRDGIVDHELLCMLAEKDPGTAQKLAQCHILDFDKYETNVQVFRTSRRELLDRLEAK
jgi:hypothetical protein